MGDGANRQGGKSQPNSCRRDGFEFSLPGSWRSRMEKVTGSRGLLCEVSRLSSPFIGFSWPRVGWEMGAPTPLPHRPFLMRGQEERWKRIIKSSSILFTSLTIWHWLGYLDQITSIQNCYTLKNCGSCKTAETAPYCGAKDNVQISALKHRNQSSVSGTRWQSCRQVDFTNWYWPTDIAYGKICGEFCTGRGEGGLFWKNEREREKTSRSFKAC